MCYSETKTEVFQPDKDTTLLVRSWLPEHSTKAVFIAIHGGMAHSGDWVTPALYFKEKSVATYGVDLRFHGTYPEYNENGRVFFHINSYEEYVHDVHQFYLWIKAKHPNTPIFVIAHSNGGLIALKYALTLAIETDIAGFIISSPWLKNRVKIPKVMQLLSKVIASIQPTFSIQPPDLTPVLTHDQTITQRHIADEQQGLRGTRVSAKLGVESEKAQNWVEQHIHKWRQFPLFAVIAGDDRLADPGFSQQVLGQISSDLIQLSIEKDNYHENFNEMNREEIFSKIWQWMSQYI